MSKEKKRMKRLLLLGAFVLIFVTAACSSQEETPQVITISTYSGNPTGTTTRSSGTTQNPATGTPATPNSTPATPGVPMTGADIRLLDCQFCINKVAQALLILPQTAKFEVLNPSTSTSNDINSTGCSSVDTFSGRQVVICRGLENTSLNLKICTADNNCQQLKVPLQPCPLSQSGTPEVNTPTPGATPTPAAGATNTPAASGSPTATP